MEPLLFQEACDRVINMDYQRDSIGILKEKTLHAVLKYYKEPHVENHEIKIGGFVADIVGEQGIVEIQTQGFDRLRKKLTAFLAVNTVTIVYPIAQTKWLYWIDEETGEPQPKRKSPKKGSLYEASWELSKIRDLLLHPNLTVCLLFLELEEYRWLNGWSKDKKKGSERCDRIPLAIVDEVLLREAADYEAFLPPALTQPFTVKEFMKLVKLSEKRVRCTISVLCEVGVLRQCGKCGRAFLYEKVDSVDFTAMEGL